MKSLSALMRSSMVVVGLSAASLTGCAVVVEGGSSAGATPGGGTTSGGGTTPSGDGSPTGTPGKGPPLGYPGIKPGATDELYASSSTSLYRWHVPSYDIEKVGDFDCLAQPSDIGTADEGIHDIAINKDGYMFGVAKVHWTSSPFTESHVIVAIDGTTAHCEEAFIIDNTLFPGVDIPQLRGLSFVPKGTLDPSNETLVALTIDGTYVKLDLAAKTTTLLGNLNTGGIGSWATKGADIASVPGDKTYVTAKDFSKDGDDRLAVLDPTTGAITAEVGSLGPETFAGIAYVNGSLHGFSAEGNMFFIEADTAHTTHLVINGEPMGIEFTGAAAASLAKPD